jgi:hypothetical protein
LNWIFHALGALRPSATGAVNTHCRAAFNERSAKYRLGPVLSSVASVTLPAGSTCTLTPTLTVPWIVDKAFADAAGATWSNASPSPKAESELFALVDTVGSTLRGATGGGVGVTVAGGVAVLAGGLVVDFAAGNVSGGWTLPALELN